DGVGGDEWTDQEGVGERHEGQGGEQRLAQNSRRLSCRRNQAEPKSHRKGRRRRQQPKPVGAAPPRRDPKFPIKNRQKTHLRSSLAGGKRRAEAQNDFGKP